MTAQTKLHELHTATMPQLYKCALLMLGDSAAAELAAAHAFASVCPQESAHNGAAGLEFAFFEKLLLRCNQTQRNTHYIHEGILPDSEQPLLRGLAALTYEDRIPLVLTLVCGYPVRVIARLTGQSEEAVSRRLSRGSSRVAAAVRGHDAACGRESA